MQKPISLNKLFERKIFRIPDYQRGYAWSIEQLKDFWEDLINLSDDRSHYTGVLTLKKVDENEIRETDNEYWLIEDRQYTKFDIVDGQQRLTTFVIMLQALINTVSTLEEFKDMPVDEIYLTESLSISNIINTYLYENKPRTERFRTYKFGYNVDNPSYEYLRYKIFNEDGAGTVNETFYTLNLKNALKYFEEQLKELYINENFDGLVKIYRKLTKQFLFNEYIIEDEFDVFVAFETMNNRGKKLSDLEKLKNRLIYLSTLYSDEEIDEAVRNHLRNEINNAWKEVYGQLGRNEKKPLNDDDFLKAHWTLYFQYSRKKGNDYIKFLLEEQFTPQKVHKKTEKFIILEEQPIEQRTYFDEDDDNEEDLNLQDVPGNGTKINKAILAHEEIIKYVQSLKSCAVYWFNTYFPDNNLDPGLKEALERLNRIGMGYFRPLVMSILKNVHNFPDKVRILNKIERFIFINFKLNQWNTTYKNSTFYNYARELDRGTKTVQDIENELDNILKESFNENNYFKSHYFFNYMEKKFETGKNEGYYGWNGLKYFLYEYELDLLKDSRQQKVSWDNLLKTEKDRISIEHIFPQTPNLSWVELFKGRGVGQENFKYLTGSLGNLLLLSSSINSSLQNDDFDNKKHPKYNENGEKIRNGYSDGSHSEIEVSKYPQWTEAEITERGLKLLNFLELRWDIKFESENTKLSLLFFQEFYPEPESSQSEILTV